MWRHVYAQRRELFRVPTGAQTGEHALSANEHGKLREVSDEQRRMQQTDIRDERADDEALRHCCNGREHHERVVGPISLRAFGSERDEEVIGRECTGYAEIVEARDSIAQRTDVRNRTQHDVDVWWLSHVNVLPGLYREHEQERDPSWVATRGDRIARDTAR